MHRTLGLIALFALSTTLSAAQVQATDVAPERSARGQLREARQFIIHPEHVLSDDERATLAAAGVDVRRALGSGRYLVRAAGLEAFAGSAGILREIEPLTAERKMHPTVASAAAKARPYARVSVLFEEEVPFEEARELIYSAGGTFDNMLEYEFEPMQRVVALIPASKLASVAGDHRVVAMFGAPRLRIAPDNAQAAALSNVTPLHTAPYDLTGKDVVLSFFELGAADAAHPEFEGRLTTKFTGGSDGEHATHVAGTMIAAGKMSAAKGMAPEATLNAFSARSGFLREKETTLPTLGVVADNNSWGYILGWDSNEGWVWTGNADLYGGYIDINATVDKITKSANVLFVHSSGNEGEKVGPNVAPFSHYHEDDDGNPVRDKTYCYSQDGSGTDCPTTVCTAGPQYCEIIRHPVNSPYNSVGLMGSSKNVVTVGAVMDATNLAGFSSRGPTRDGRVKPDVVARGVGVYSTILNNTYGRKQGTSMASPVVTGISALITQQWRRTFNGASPRPAVLKALLIAGADDMGTPGPDYKFGHGLANAKASVDLIRDDNATGSRIRVANATQGSQAEVPISVTAGQKLRVTLVWTDPEVLNFEPDGTAAATLVNDLDLKVLNTSGENVLPYVLSKSDVEAPATRGVNTVDNVEVVEVAGAAAGTYRVVVTGTRIAAQSPQEYVLVANAPIGAAIVPCTDPTEPNETLATAYGFIGSTQTVMGRICSSTDVDNFKFKVDRVGTITVTVTATDTPVMVKVTGEGFPSATSAVVPPGESRNMQLQYSGSAPTPFNIEVTPNGTVGANGSYFVTAKFPLSAPARRRSSAR